MYSTDVIFQLLLQNILHENVEVVKFYCAALLTTTIRDMKFKHILYWLMVHKVNIVYIEFILSFNLIDINMIDEYTNENILFYVAKENLMEYAKLLIEKDININQYSLSNDSAFLWAIYYRHTDMVNILMSYNVDLYHCYRDGKNSFMWATFRNSYSIFKLLKPFIKEIHLQDNKGNDIYTLTSNNIIKQEIKELVYLNIIYLYNYFHSYYFDLKEYNILLLIRYYYSNL